MPRLKHLPGACGLDEAGRGPLAGPVVAAAVVLPKNFNRKGLNDSKQLTPLQREEMAERIKRRAVWAFAVVEVEEIDRINILWASMAAMEIALSLLDECPEEAWVDGNCLPRNPRCPCRALVGGDGRMACIAAASIIAKTERDRLMRELAGSYPGYGFERHFGYSTPQHFAALRELGPCAIHRRTFGPVREILDQPCLTFDA